MQKKEHQIYYPFLDGFRTIGIIGVLLAHISGFSSTQKGLVYQAIAFLGPLGHLGVDIFFVISGFLITGILIESYEQNIDIKRFYVRRFFKIVPQYIIVVLFGFLLSWVYKTDQNLISYLSYFFYFQNYVPPIITLAHGWSLAIEEHYYFFYPLIIWTIFALCKNTRNRRWFLLSFCVFLSVLTIWGRHGHNHMDFLSAWLKVRAFSQTTFYRIDGLLFGCILKLLEPFYVIKGYKKEKILTILYFLSGAFLFYYLSIGLNPHAITDFWDKYLLTYFATGLLFLSAHRGFRPIKFILESFLFRWIGRISYAIYLWHYPVILIFKNLIPNFGVTICMVASIIATITIAAISTNTIEKYFLNLREKVMP